ncbi:hypothetical protein, unlikely [Trypanosoma brucei gambiense DAL972]|uniref:Uncharacterized protein n=1 Tax=Trypanosoma brucei gambiense (strain MHOM/CI/86/DAL972) TaxID=679716 RepID=D0A624_TRYB9|nr:hypothetical protein, unlikely [Trypanosoma brucei gambiense DAL972]CBH17125.1 hypothetical protein, unlikely [Trypanosoma brucei gambiense DAL972]|eukprot:XP_011779389.1 hypothetical protein, unlikely [Trypanosoma brucei gambiense DAL972]
MLFCFIASPRLTSFIFFFHSFLSYFSPPLPPPPFLSTSPNTATVNVCSSPHRNIFLLAFTCPLCFALLLLLIIVRTVAYSSHVSFFLCCRPLLFCFVMFCLSYLSFCLLFVNSVFFSVLETMRSCRRKIFFASSVFHFSFSVFFLFFLIVFFL